MVQKEPAEMPIRLLGGISFFILSTISVILNLLLATVLLKDRKKFGKNAFFTLIWQLLLSDLMEQSVQLIVAVPTTMAGVKLFGDSLALELFLHLDSVAFHSTLFFSMLMTLNRLSVFFLPSVNKSVFTAPRIHFTIGLCWLFVVGFVAAYAFSGCHKAFSEGGFFMYNKCPAPSEKSNLNISLNWWDYYSSTYIPLAMLIAYSVMFLHIRYFVNNTGGMQISDNEKARKRRERKFLVQAFLICGFLELQNMAFIYVPKVPVTGQLTYLLTFLTNWSEILLNTLSPLILFSCNSEIRFGLRNLLKRGSVAGIKSNTILAFTNNYSMANGNGRDATIRERNNPLTKMQYSNANFNGIQPNNWMNVTK